MKRPEFVYITHARLPTEKAHGIQIVHTVYGFGKYFRDVRLLLAQQPNPIVESLDTYYQLSEARFSVVTIWSLSILRAYRIGYWIRSLTFSFCAFIYLLMTAPKIVYSREPFPLLLLTFLPIKTVYEMHNFPETHRWFHAFMCRRVDHVVTTNQWAYTQCKDVFHLPVAKLRIAPNGYDEKIFIPQQDTVAIRRTLQWSIDRQVIMYSGNLMEWKGIHVFLEASALCPEYLFVVVGGVVEEQSKLQHRYSGENILFIPHTTQDRVAKYLAAADVLVLPNIPTNEHSEFATSPIKLFEYMAMGKPIIASDLYSIRAIVSEHEVTFFKPGEPADLARKIHHVCEHAQEYTQRSDRVLSFVSQFTWDNRARNIYDFVKST